MGEAAVEGQGTPPQSGGDGGTPPQATDWREGLGDDLRGYVENKGWESPGSMVESYRNLEKLQGVPADRLLKLPDSDAGMDEWGPIYDRLGRPEKAEHYKIDLPEGFGDENFASHMKGLMHEAGLPREMGEKLAAGWNRYMTEMHEQEVKQYQDQIATEERELRSELGQAYDAKINQARQVAREIGLDGEQAAALEEALGFAGTMRFMMNLGEKFGEDGFLSGGGEGFQGAMTPAQAQARIQELRRDEGFTKKYLEGDVGARREMDRLHKMAYPEG